MNCDLSNSEKALPAKGEKEDRKQQERTGVMRKTEDGKNVMVPIVSRDQLAGEMRKAS